MTVDDFIARHQLRQLPADERFIPYELYPVGGVGEDEIRFYVNSEHTVGLGINTTRHAIRVVYAELGLADTGWIPQVAALESTGFKYDSN